MNNKTEIITLRCTKEEKELIKQKPLNRHSTISNYAMEKLTQSDSANCMNDSFSFQYRMKSSYNLYMNHQISNEEFVNQIVKEMEHNG